MRVTSILQCSWRDTSISLFCRLPKLLKASWERASIGRLVCTFWESWWTLMNRNLPTTINTSITSISPNRPRRPLFLSRNRTSTNLWNKGTFSTTWRCLEICGNVATASRRWPNTTEAAESSRKECPNTARRICTWTRTKSKQKTKARRQTCWWLIDKATNQSVC